MNTTNHQKEDFDDAFREMGVLIEKRGVGDKALKNGADEGKGK